MIRNPWNLTERQIEVIELAATGLTAKQIGSVLHLSSKTVDVHFERLMGQMQVNSRLMAVLRWDRLNRAYERVQPQGTYLSGPMTGLPDKNRAAFMRGAAMLRAAGHIVVNPAEFDLPEDITWTDAMRRDIPDLCTCANIALLPGWEWSKGSKGELAVARLLSMREIYLNAEELRAAA